MSRNAVRMKLLFYSWAFVVYSKNSHCIPDIFAPILEADQNVFVVLKTEDFRSAFAVEKYRTAFKAYSSMKFRTGRPQK